VGFDQKYILVIMKSTHYSCPVLIKLESSQQILKNSHTSNFTKIRPAGAVLFHADRQT
jgi:hypothetical protein